MQLRKFYGRTLSGTLSQVKRALGPDAFIVDTRSIAEGSPESRLNPGAKFEVSAAREAHAANAASMAGAAQARSAQSGLSPERRRGFLADLGQLRAEIKDLLSGDANSIEAAGLDIAEYRSLIELGVSAATLAVPLRRWLSWRTSNIKANAEAAAIAVRMKGRSLSEWLWLTWGDGLKLDTAPHQGNSPHTTEIVAVVGPTGGGKTTTLAKLTSIKCHIERQKCVVISLDSKRVGASEQWKRYAGLMGVGVENVVTQEELALSMQSWHRYDWVGIDTPGGMTAGDDPGKAYGAILAQCPDLKTLLVLPATHEESAGRAQMARARDLGAQGMIVTKLDETQRRGQIVNLTMGSGGAAGRNWRLHGLTMGTRVPTDYTIADRPALWNQVLAGGAR